MAIFSNCICPHRATVQSFCGFMEANSLYKFKFVNETLYGLMIFQQVVVIHSQYRVNQDTPILQPLTFFCGGRKGPSKISPVLDIDKLKRAHEYMLKYCKTRHENSYFAFHKWSSYGSYLMFTILLCKTVSNHVFKKINMHVPHFVTFIFQT